MFDCKCELDYIRESNRSSYTERRIQYALARAVYIQFVLILPRQIMPLSRNVY